MDRSAGVTGITAARNEDAVRGIVGLKSEEDS